MQMIGARTMSEHALRDPSALTRPLSPENWFLRIMIFEHERRERVMAGRADPTPFEPWRICTPEDVKAWRKRHEEKTRRFTT